MTPQIRDAFTIGASIAEVMRRRANRDSFFKMYPWEDNMDILNEKGEPVYYARSKYPKHMEFFKAGATYRERCAMAANRVGKTFGMGGYELTCHLTGDYPSWWKGRRFTRPIKAWAAGKTNETTRDIIQTTLLGELHKTERGRRSFDMTGLLPWRAVSLADMQFKRSMDLIDRVRVRHKSGGWSVLGFKSYEQGRGSFEGTAQHVIWLDEEPPLDIYSECVIRTATTDGIVLLTFTPLEGMSETVMQFMPQSMKPE